MNGRILKEIFKEFEIYGNLDAEFSSIKTDSRKVEKGELFVALKGEDTDGHRFVLDALKNGAVGVIVEKEVEVPMDTLVIKARDAREAFAKISSIYFGEPSKSLKIVGVTGTMGKTTITYLLYRLFNHLGIPSGFIGTIGLGIRDNFSLTDLEPPTTPFPFDLHRYLKNMLENGVEYVFMEVSSHGIKDKRVYGIEFYKKILATMGIDHIDYHKSPEDYINTKVSFFEGAKSPVLNGDSLFIDRFIEVSDSPILYGKESTFDFWFSSISEKEASISFDVYRGKHLQGLVELPILGMYNAYNFLAVLSFAMLEGISFNDIKEFANTVSVPGRMEVYNFNGITVVIDYAHNPEEIENVLKSLRNLNRRLIVVFGSVGTSDKEKRILMGKTVSNYADFCVVTSDDPRGHDVDEIIEDVVTGISIDSVVLRDRREAIKYALENASKGDVVAILGRGVESKMRLPGGEVISFRDIDIVRGVFNEN